MSNRKLILITVLAILSVLLIVQAIVAMSGVGSPGYQADSADTEEGGQAATKEVPGPRPDPTMPPSKDAPSAPLGGGSITVPE